VATPDGARRRIADLQIMRAGIGFRWVDAD
jgi:hypothetical protein